MARFLKRSLRDCFHRGAAMLKRKILFVCALTGAELLAGGLAAHAGGMAGLQHVGNVSSRLGALNCKNVSTGHSPGLNVYGAGGNSITNNVNRSTNINVNKPLTVYSPVNVTNNIDNSTNISSNVNINNSKYIDNSTNITVNKDINVSTTNIFNGMGSGSNHSQGGSWGSHTGGMGGTGCGSMCGSGQSGGGSNNNGNNNNNGNGNSNGNSNSNGNGNDNSSNNTINNSNGINASAAIGSFFNGLHGFQ
jgi:hypothetical protein